MTITAAEFASLHAFTPDNYPPQDCDAANAALLTLAADPANARYLELDEYGVPVWDGRDLCDRANDSI